MDALDDLADPGLDAGFFSEISHVLAGLANDNAGFLGGNDSPECELRLRVFFFSFGRLIFSFANIELVQGIGQTIVVHVVDIDRGLSRSHCGGMAMGQVGE